VLSRRKGPLIVTALVVTSGMAFSFMWLPLTVEGFYHQFWVTPGDIWAAYRTGQWIGWGAYGSLYSATASYITFPGLAIVLAPLALFTQALGLSDSFPYAIPHPTAWLLLGPVEVLLGCSALFALDALCERLGVSARRRVAVTVVEGVLLWPLLVRWGHPEDAISLAFAVYSLIAVLDHRWSRAGWLLGAAISFQPLVLLVVPVFISTGSWIQIRRLLLRTAGLPASLLVLPFASDWHDTWHAVVEQPTKVALAHVTPWTFLAPKLGAGYVSCGPTRLIAITGACWIGWYVARRSVVEEGAIKASTLVWCAAICLGLRFATESALEGYYVWPAIALFVVAGGVCSKPRLLVSATLAIGTTVATCWRFGSWWVWWGTTMTALILVALSSVRAGAQAGESLGGPCAGRVPQRDLTRLAPRSSTSVSVS